MYFIYEKNKTNKIIDRFLKLTKQTLIYESDFLID